MTGPSTTPSARLSSPGQRVCSPSLVGDRAALDDSGADIHDEVNRNPESDGEIPIEAVVCRVAKGLHWQLLREEEDCETDRIEQIEQQERSMKADDRPR